MAFTTGVTPDRGKKSYHIAIPVQAPGFASLSIEIDREHFAASIWALKNEQTRPCTFYHHDVARLIDQYTGIATTFHDSF